MIEIFAAGNFVLMNSPKKEKKFIEEVTKRTGTCNRLISFFFKKEMKTIINIQNGIEEAPKLPKLIRREKPKVKTKTEHIKKFSLVIGGKEICSGLTEEEMWIRIGKYASTVHYSVMDSGTSNYSEEFIPF